MLKHVEHVHNMLDARRQAIIRARYICWLNAYDWGEYKLELQAVGP